MNIKRGRIFNKKRNKPCATDEVVEMSDGRLGVSPEWYCKNKKLCDEDPAKYVVDLRGKDADYIFDFLKWDGFFDLP